MKHLLVGFYVVLLLAVAVSDTMAQKGRGGQGRGSGRTANLAGNRGGAFYSETQKGALSSGNMNNRGESDLLRLREEEKLARDVYLHLAKSSGLGIFNTIARAENQHMQAIERLILRSGMNSVAQSDAAGKFSFPEYQQLYGTLIAKGSQSSLNALMVGARIEEMDIADIKRLLAQTSSPQVQQVLSHLLQGSQNHLRAFSAQIKRQGGVYRAEFLTQAEFDQIANSPVQGQGQGQQGTGRVALKGGQRGRRNAGGRGSGRGR